MSFYFDANNDFQYCIANNVLWWLHLSHCVHVHVPASLVIWSVALWRTWDLSQLRRLQHRCFLTSFKQMAIYMYSQQANRKKTNKQKKKQQKIKPHTTKLQNGSRFITYNIYTANLNPFRLQLTFYTARYKWCLVSCIKKPVPQTPPTCILTLDSFLNRHLAHIVTKTTVEACQIIETYDAYLISTGGYKTQLYCHPLTSRVSLPATTMSPSDVFAWLSSD